MTKKTTHCTKTLFSRLFSLAQDLKGPFLSHWSVDGWNIRVLLSRQGDLSRGKEKNWSKFYSHKLPWARIIETFLDGHGMLPGKFTVRNACLRLNDVGLRCPFALTIWKVKAPLKVRAFMWLVINGATLTWDNLKKRNWHGPDICTICMADDETLDHIFLNCTFSSHVWTLLALCFWLFACD